MDHTSEKFSSLIDRAKKADQAAQGQLVSMTQTKLFKFCVLLGHNRELAEDLCQEVYIKAFKNIEKLKNAEAFQSWLYQIAKNLFIDLKRSQKEFASDRENAESSLSNLETVLQVQQALSQFETEDRFLLLIIELEGLSYKEAAEIVKTTEDAVRSKLHRLRKFFIKNLK